VGCEKHSHDGGCGIYRPASLLLGSPWIALWSIGGLSMGLALERTIDLISIRSALGQSSTLFRTIKALARWRCAACACRA